MITIPVLCIAISMVFIIDLSGFVIAAKRKWWQLKHPNEKFMYFDFKPLDCSLCMTLWASLAYMILTWRITPQNIAIICLFSFSTSLLKDALILAYDLVSYAVYWIRDRYIKPDYDGLDDE